MAKSKIISDLVNDAISLTQALDRLLIIAMEIGDNKTVNWAECEKNGYSKPSSVPSYRIIRINEENSYPITVGIIHLNSIYIKYKKGDVPNCPLISECSISADENALRKAECKTCIKIDKILEAVRTEFIKRTVKLEKKFGLLDEFDIIATDFKDNNDKTFFDKVVEMMNNNEKNTVNITFTNNGGKISNFANNTKKEKTSSNDVNIQTNVAVNKKEGWLAKFFKLFKRKKK